MDDMKSFQIEEYKGLRKEIDLYLREARTQERYAVLATGAIWAWLIANKKTSGGLWAVPVLTMLLVSLRTYAISQHFGDLRTHIQKLEKAFGFEGWEHREIVRWDVGTAAIILNYVLLTAGIVAWCFRRSLVGA